MSRPDPDETRDHTRPPRNYHTDDGEPPVVVEFAVPAEKLALANALGAFPEVVLQFEHLVPTNHNPLPFFWATDGHPPAFQRAVADDPNVAHVQQAARFEGGALYSVEWTTNPDGLLDWIVSDHEQTVILESHAQTDEWTLKFRFPTRTHLSSFQAFCDDRGIDPRVIRLYDLSSAETAEYSVSAKQREALLRALEMGHFEIPRQATLEDVAGSLGISARALSERLRRGQTNLVGHTLALDHPASVGLGEL